MALVRKWLKFLLPIFWALSSFFVLLLFFPNLFSFLYLFSCLFLSSVASFPWLRGICSHLPSVCLSSSFFPGSLPCNTSLSGRPVRLQELCEQSSGCQSKGWSLHSDQCHDRDESLPLAVGPVQSCWVHHQPPRPRLQPGQWGGHRKTQGRISWQFICFSLIRTFLWTVFILLNSKWCNKMENSRLSVKTF